jgi:putative transposase
MRNALSHVQAKRRPAVAAMLKTIFAQETAKEAHAQWKTVADTLRDRAPRLAALTDGARGDVLAYTAFPNGHWPQIAGTNPLERPNGEVKRRSDVVGIFPDDRAVVRLVGALMLEQNDEWTVSRRYMSLECLAAVSRIPLVRLPAIAA